MERRLIEYLPLFLRDCAQLQGIAEVEQTEFVRAWSAAEALLDDQFVPTAGRAGLARWEKLLELSPKGTDTLEQRRGAVLARLNERLPYTLPRLRELLDTVCGAGHCTAAVEDYTLTVTVALEAKEKYDTVASLLERVTPCNLALSLIQRYNTHGELGRFTHGGLSRFSHHQLRNEVLPYGNENDPLRTG